MIDGIYFSQLCNTYYFFPSSFEITVIYFLFDSIVCYSLCNTHYLFSYDEFLFLFSWVFFLHSFIDLNWYHFLLINLLGYWICATSCEILLRGKNRITKNINWFMFYYTNKCTSKFYKRIISPSSISFFFFLFVAENIFIKDHSHYDSCTIHFIFHKISLEKEY